MNRFFSFRHCIDLFLDFVTLFRKLMLILAFNEKVSQPAARAGGKAGLLFNLWEMGGLERWIIHCVEQKCERQAPQAGGKHRFVLSKTTFPKS